MASENEAKIEVFWLLFRKRRFYENRAPVEAKLLFFTFRASEKRLKIDANIDLEKNIEKNPQKSIFPSKLASQNLPKSNKNRKKLQKIAFEKNFVKKGHGPEPTLTQVKLFGTLPDYPTTFPMISTSLSIYLSIY